MKPPKHIITWLGCLFFAFYLIGILFPEAWWGSHFLAFFPTTVKYGMLAIGGFILGLSYLSFWVKLGEHLSILQRIPAWVVISLAVVLMAFMFYQFPIFHDYYGDSFEYESILNTKIGSLSDFSLEPLFSLNLSPHSGRLSMATLVSLLSYTFGLTHYQVFVWMDLICGALFVLLWLFFIHRYIKNTQWKLVLGIAGLTAPFMQIFFGHVEMYAPSILLLETWLILLILAIEKQKKWLLYLLLILLVIGVRFHPTFMLLLPAWLVALLILYKPSYKLTLKSTGKYVLAPVFALGLILYFFILGDYNDPRNLEGAQDFDRIFLPLLSPDPPLDRYNMQSFNHIFDFFQVALHWSPVALILLGSILIAYRKKVNWEKPVILITGFTLLIYVTFLFAVNPLLSMPIDWDLFMFPAPILLILTALLVREIETETNLAAKALPVALTMSLFTIPFFVMNAYAKPYSQRLESLSKHIFKTYHIWGDRYLEHAVKLTHSDEQYIRRKQAAIDELKPYAIIGNDLHYSQMIATNGLYYLRTEDDANLENARACFQEAYYYFPKLKSNILNLLQVNFRLGRHAEAYQNSVDLVGYEYPDVRKSRRMAIHCALEAGLYEEAEFHAEKYLTILPDDSLIIQVRDRLVNNEQPEQLRNLFAHN